MSLTESTEELIHGVKISDPYRWLEDRGSPEAEEWIRAQQRRCEAYFAGRPDLEAIERRVKHYLDVEIVDQPYRVLDRYYYRKRMQGQEQGSLYVRECATGMERLLIDPSHYGPNASVGFHSISRDGAFAAYELKYGGEDRKEIHFVDVARGQLLPDSIPLGYNRGLVFNDSGYLYSHEIEDAGGVRAVCYHPFGSTEKDRVVFCVPRTPGSRIVLTGNAFRWGVIALRYEGQERVTDFWIADPAETPSWREVYRGKPLPYSPFLYQNRILVLSGTAAKSNCLIELSTSGRQLQTLVPERETPIRQLVVAREGVVVGYQKQRVGSVEMWPLNGRDVESVSVPASGTIQLLPTHGEDVESFFYRFESFDTPTTIYEHSFVTKAATVWHQRGPVGVKGCYQLQETCITSKDRTSIPLTLVSRNAFDSARPAPVVMTSYGGFGVMMTPQFSVLVAIMLELGAVFAMPHIRGGGEFGEGWHDAGRGRNRQSAFDDFIAAAEWLCNEGLTTPDRLAIFGGSNSGLLVGAAMTQRPELFGAVLCIAPLLDMVRYESLGRAVQWRREYGTIEDPEDFSALYDYSPYHHVAEEMNYPATMFVTGDKDDRCNPTHVRKMAAQLQNRAAQNSPVIVDYGDERGHSATLPLSTRVQALARRIVFLLRELRIVVPREVSYETPCS